MIEQTTFGTNSFAENPEPRLASLLLLDTSASMAEVIRNAGQDLGYTTQSDGQTYRVVSGGITRIDELNAGVKYYKELLAADSLASKRVEVAIVTFGEQVQTVCDFTTVEAFQPPALTAGGSTPMGAAIQHGLGILRSRKDLYNAHGIPFFRPWVFLITDGEPTDKEKCRSAADQVKQGEKDKAFSFWAIGVEGANFDFLKQLCPPEREPLKLKGLNFRELFRWLSNSQSAVSRSTPGETVPLTDPTAGPKGWASVC